ncbi:MAG: hypothetical protein V1884_01980 [Candidatus Omnitrophota bacterium]
MYKYYLEFILNTLQDVSPEILKSSFVEFGDNLEISEEPEDSDMKGRDFKIRISTDEPTIIFDTCAQLGRIRSIKIDEKH